MIRLLRRSGIGALTLLLACSAAFAASYDLKDLIREAHSIPSTTGNEELLAARILSSLPKTGVDTDNLGSVTARFGRGGAPVGGWRPGPALFAGWRLDRLSERRRE